MTHNVELDPESASQVRQQILEEGLEFVGWYHSHPFFSPEPSEVDVLNHENY